MLNLYEKFLGDVSTGKYTLSRIGTLTFNIRLNCVLYAASLIAYIHLWGELKWSNSRIDCLRPQLAGTIIEL